MPLEPISKPDYQCIWVFGDPNMGKSYSMRTCPKPVGIISMPGEKGHSSLPYGEGYTVLRWKDDGTPTPERNTLYYMKIWREVEGATIDMMNGKYGPIETIVIDGMHKLYDLALAIATDGESAALHSAFTKKTNEKGKEVMVGEFSPFCYGKSNTMIWQFVNMVASSKVPWRIFTSWADAKKDDAKDTSWDAAKSLLPDMPNKAARQVTGEVSVTLFATMDPKGQYVWQTKSGGKAAGVGIKGDPTVVSKIPTFIPQDFGVFATYVNNNGGTQ